MAENIRLELVVVDKTGAAISRAKKNVEGVNDSLGRLAKLAAAAFSVRAVYNYANAIQNVNNRLKLVTTSQDNLNSTFNTLQQVANRSRGDLEGVVDLYSKIALSTKDLGISQATTSRITETFAKTLAISGADAQSSAGAIRQFGQALASGAFRGDEFNSVVEAAPLILDILAAQTGKTRGEIRGLASDGKLTADVLINALLNSSKMVDEQFGKTSATIGQSLTVLQNNFLALGRTSSPVFESIAKGILVVANNLDTAVTFAISFGAALAVGKVVMMARAVGGLTGAMKALNLMMMRNPLLLFASGVAIAITAIYQLLEPLLKLEGAFSVKLLYALEKFVNGFINGFEGLGRVAIEFGSVLYEAITRALTLKDPREAFTDFGGRMKSAFQEAFDNGGPFKFVSDEDRENLEKQLREVKNAGQIIVDQDPILIQPKIDQEKLRKELEETMEGLTSVARTVGGVFQDTFGASYVKESQKLQDALTKNLITLEEYHHAVAVLERKAQLEREARNQKEREDAIALIKKGKATELDIENAFGKEKKGLNVALGKELLGELSQINEKAFKIAKAVAISETIINTAKGVMFALGRGAYLQAALIAATGAVQIAKIKSTSYVGPREKGGPVSGGQPYLVGEAGPEMFVPNAGGTIVPNNQMGGNVNINFTINAVDSRGIDQVLIERRNTIIGVINEALNKKGRVGITS